MILPRPANSELFPTTAPGLALDVPLPFLRATLWDDGHGRRVARCGEIATRGDVSLGEMPVGALCCALVDAGVADSMLVVRWWDLQPAETIRSFHAAAADVRAEVAKRPDREVTL